MKLYIASANSDWGFIYRDEQIKGSNWNVAFNRAGYLAQKRARRRPKQITISLRLVGMEPKKTIEIDLGKDTDYLGLPADKDTPEETI